MICLKVLPSWIGGFLVVFTVVSLVFILFTDRSFSFPFMHLEGLVHAEELWDDDTYCPVV